MQHPPFEAIREVLDYTWADEEENFNEREAAGEDCSTHIFLALRQVRDWLQACGEDRPSERWQAGWAEWARREAEDTNLPPSGPHRPRLKLVTSEGGHE